MLLVIPLIIAALGSLAGSFFHEAIGHVVVDWLLDRIGPEAAHFISFLVPYVVLSGVSAYVGYIAGKHMREGSKEENAERQALVDRAATAEAEKAALGNEKKDLVAELGAVKIERDKLIRKIEELLSRPVQVQQMMNQVLGIVGSASLDLPTIVRRLRFDNDDQQRQLVVEAVGQLQLDGRLVAGTLPGEFRFGSA